MPGLVAGAIAGSSVLGAGASLAGSGKAAGASKQAAFDQYAQYLQTANQLQPFHDFAVNQIMPAAVGLALSGPTAGGPDYISLADSLQPGQMTEAQLEQTPGYQFTLDQNLKSVQSGAAARGLGVSGASMKAAADYATGLASNTYQQQFNIAQTRFQNALNLNTAQQGNIQNQANRLQSLANLGEAAAAGTGQIGATLAGNAGNYLTAAGQAQAAGTTGVANALTGGVNSYLGYNALQQLIGAQSPTGGFVDNTSSFV